MTVLIVTARVKKLIKFTNVQASHLEPSGATTSFRCRRSSSSPHQLQVIQYIQYNNQQRPNPNKTWCMGPYAGVDYNPILCRLQSRLQHMYHGHWATLCQSQLYPPDRDLGFGLRSSCYRSRSLSLNTGHGRKLSWNTRPALKNCIMPEKVSQCSYLHPENPNNQKIVSMSRDQIRLQFLTFVSCAESCLSDGRIHTFDSLVYTMRQQGTYTLYRHTTLPYEVQVYYRWDVCARTSFWRKDSMLVSALSALNFVCTMMFAVCRITMHAPSPTPHPSRPQRWNSRTSLWQKTRVFFCQLFTVPSTENHTLLSF